MSPARNDNWHLENCRVDGCEKRRANRRLPYCYMHAARKSRHGDFNFTKEIHGDDKARFWSYVNKSGPNGCWEWTGPLTQGYGHARIEGKGRRAHAVSLEWATGEAASGRFACHHCDNRACVNPEHLYWGSRADNTRDAVERDRVIFGEKSIHAKLTEESVEEIRERYAGGAFAPELAKEYGISANHLRGIASGLYWKRAGGPRTSRGNAKRVTRSAA